MSTASARVLSAPLLAILAGCSGMTEPSDVAEAEKACASHGGWASVARYEHGKNIIVNCKDGAHVDLRIGDAK
jgi:hypothetical protein